MFELVINFWQNSSAEVRAAIISSLVAISILVIEKVIEIRIARSGNRIQEKEIYSKYVEFSLQKKLEVYQDLIYIIREVGLGSSYFTGVEKEYSQREKTLIIRRTLKNLLSWEYNSGGYFLLSSESYQYFRQLLKRLKANPEFNEKGYSQRQLDNITGTVAGFRLSLVKDLAIYRIAEDSFANRKKIDYILKKERDYLKRKVKS